MGKPIDLRKKTKISKTELVASVAARLSVPKETVSCVANGIFDEIGRNLRNGVDVTIMDFGSFKLQKVQSRKGRNIHTGENVVIPARKRVKFKAGKHLSEVVSLNE